MDNSQLSVKRMIEKLRKNPNVKEKELGNKISSFNFTRKAFKKGIWDNESVKARGLFINTETNEIVNRAYNKFFNVGEVEETTLKSLKETLAFPVRAYLKYNGFLGMLGYNEQKDELIFSSKSSIDSIHVKWFKEIFYKHLVMKGICPLLIKDFLKKQGVSLVFEVCDGVNDEHIIDLEGERKLYLLDVIDRDVKYKDQEFLRNFVSSFAGFENKQLIRIFNDYISFYNFYKEVEEKDYLMNGKYIEGFVCKDANNFQIKIKTPYYKKMEENKIL